MIRRLLRLLPAALVLGGVVYWANCSFNPQRLELDPNRLFAGCFEGEITDPAGRGSLILIFEDPGPMDNLTLTGCMQLSIGPGTTLATLAGMVQERREEAVLTVMPTNGRPAFTVTAVRDPAGEVNATTMDVSDTGGAPFNAANDLPRCSPVRDCASLGISQPFMPGGGMQ